MANSPANNTNSQDGAKQRPFGPPDPPGGRMPLAQRAKIFIPFEPLKGFTEAIREKEYELEAAHPQMHAFHHDKEDSANAEATPN